ncbi:MAG: DMT family transporter [Candidatus Cloacimonetes bacterium]|nr:DMT family transporter [Candidatus Cloacimonadota bacterium]
MKKNFKYYILACFAIFVWGISLVSTKVLLGNGFTPNIITFFRFFIAWLVILIFQKRSTEHIKKGDQKYFSFLAVTGISLFYFFENIGLKYTTVANTSLITATIPLFTLLTAYFFYKKKLVTQNWIGIILSLTGSFLLFYKDIIHSSIHLKGDILVFGSVIMWISYSFIYKTLMNKYSASFIIRKIFLYAIIFLIPLIIFDLKSIVSINWELNVIMHLLFLSVICSYLGYYFWNIAIKKIGVKIISNLILFIPVVSISTGIIFLSEPFTWNLIYSAILIISGAYFTSISEEEHKF